MNRAVYYEEMKRLAHELRERYGMATGDVSLSRVRAIYKAEGIRIDYWRHKLRKVRAAYFLVDEEPHVLLNAGIKPKEPRIFALCHELKHHLLDREVARGGGLGCREDVSWQNGSPVEIGAEIFAAEFIFPESEFLTLVREVGVEGKRQAEEVVKLRRASPAPISYTFLLKRLRWFRIIGRDEYRGVQFQKLEAKLYGGPFYRRRPSRDFAAQGTPSHAPDGKDR